MKALCYLAMLGFVFVLGCSGGEKETTEKSVESNAAQEKGNSAQQSFDTPEAVYAAFSESVAKDDWKSAITMVTEETQKMFVMGMVMQAGFMTMDEEAKGKELEQLFKKHGLDKDLEEVSGEDVEVDSLVEDFPTFVGELAAWIKANEKDSENGFPEMKEMSELKIDGDKATAMTETVMGKQPIEFRKVDGQWKVHLAMGPPPEPTIDELGLDFDKTGDGKIGSLQYGEKKSGLNHAFAYNAKFFDEPCIMLLLTAEEISEEKQKELEQSLKENDGDALFFADGPKVQLTLSPEGELLSMFAWIDNSSSSSNRGPAVDVKIDGKKISGRVGMLPKDYGGETLEFQAKFETEIRY